MKTSSSADVKIGRVCDFWARHALMMKFSAEEQHIGVSRCGHDSPKQILNLEMCRFCNDTILLMIYGLLSRPLLHHLTDKDCVPLQIHVHFHIQFH